jgi:hypothetical protein
VGGERMSANDQEAGLGVEEAPQQVEEVVVHG